MMHRSDPSQETGLQKDLIPVNAVIGFLKRDRRWPSPLYEIGYRLTMIEQPVSVAGGAAVEVDVICLNHSRNHAILWECKSGHTIDERQAHVYAAATAEDVQRTGNVTFPHVISASVEAIYCCLEADTKVVIDSIRKSSLQVPVISLGERAVLASGELKDPDARALFTAGITLPRLDEVPRFLIANTHTSKARVATLVFATIVSFLRKQRGKFSVRHILEETFPDWACMGTDLRRHLSDTVKGIVLELCKSELKEFARTVKATHSPGEFFVEFTANVLGQDASIRTRHFQKLARLAYGYIQRTEERRPYEPAKEVESMWLPGFEPGS